MPYIKQEERRKFDAPLRYINTAMESKGISPGELNYLVTTIFKLYLKFKGPNNYTPHNDILGVLEGAKLEFYRRQVVEFEERKLKENGDLL